MRVASFSCLNYNKSIPKKAWLLIMAGSSSTGGPLIETIQKQKVVISSTKTGWFITQQHFHETQFDFRYKNNCVWRTNTCFSDADGETTAQTRWNHLFVTFPKYQGYKGRLWNCVCCITISLQASFSQRTWKQEDPDRFSVKSWKRSGHFSIWSKT